MKLIKEFAWYGSAVTFAALTAVALLFAAPAGQASAAMSGLRTTCDGQLVNSPNKACTISFTTSVAVTDVGAGNPESVVDFVFDTDTVAGNTVASYTLTGPAGAIAIEAVTVTGNNALRLEVGDVNLAVGGYELSLAAGAITTWAKTITQTGTLKAQVGAANATTAAQQWTGGSAGDNETIATVSFDEGLQSAQSSVVADGISTAVISFNSNDAAGQYTNNDTLTFSTTAGTFTGFTDGTSSSNQVINTTAGSQLMTANTDLAAAASSPTLIVLKSSTTIETATIRVYTTPAAGGTAVLAHSITVSFVVAPGATASAVITPVAAVTAGKSATTSAITVTLKDALGNTPTVGESASVTSTRGTFGSLTGMFAGFTGTGTQSVSGTLVSDSGTFTLTGLGLAGASTVTFTRGTVSATKTVTFSGTTSTVTGSTTSSISPAAWTYIGSGTISNDAPKVRFTLKDADGNVVGGVTPTLTQDPVGAVTFGAVGASSSTYGRSDTTITAENVATATEVTVTATVGSGASAKTGTVTFTVGGTSASTVEVTAADVAPVTVSTIDVVVKDSSGNIMQDGTPITAVVTAGSLVATTADTSGGLATFTYVSPGTAQSVNFTAITGTKTGSATFNVGTVAEVVVVEPVATVAALTAPPAGGLTQGAAGTDDLTALVDAQTFDVESVWKLDVATQTFQSYFPGAAAFANTLTAIAATDIVTIRSQ